MADLIPGMSIGGLSGAGGVLTTMVTWFSYLVMFGAVVGAITFIMWFINRKILRFTIPVTLKFEVGGTILQKQDKIWLKRSGDKWDIKFQKNPKLIANIPPDKLGFQKASGLKTVKTFEGYVRDNQVVWVWPQPQTKLVVPAHEEADEKGELVQIPEQTIETFQTIPTNMVESYIHQLSKNAELLLKKKWWQDPVIIAWGAMGFMIIAVIFIYLLYKNIPEQINGYLAFAKTLAQNCQGAQIK